MGRSWDPPVMICYKKRLTTTGAFAGAEALRYWRQSHTFKRRQSHEQLLCSGASTGAAQVLTRLPGLMLSCSDLSRRALLTGVHQSLIQSDQSDE